MATGVRGPAHNGGSSVTKNRSVPGTSDRLPNLFHGTTAGQLEEYRLLERLLLASSTMWANTRTGAPGTMTTMLGNARCPWP